MMDELPGIFNRLVWAWQLRQHRGQALDADQAVQREFEEGSDRVQQWLNEEMTIVIESEGRRLFEGMQLDAEAFEFTSDAKSLRILFNAWAEENGVGTLGRNTLAKRLTSKNGVIRVRVGPTRKERFNICKRSETEDPEASEASDTTSGDTRKSSPEGPMEGRGERSGEKASGASKSLRIAAADPCPRPGCRHEVELNPKYFKGPSWYCPAHGHLGLVDDTDPGEEARP
jgi:phage/plasmid-associated DNA primase